MRLYVGGAFDMLHTTHVDFLRRVSELGEVWVGVSADGYDYLGRTPVMNHAERRRPVEALPYVHNINENPGPPGTQALLAGDPARLHRPRRRHHPACPAGRAGRHQRLAEGAGDRDHASLLRRGAVLAAGVDRIEQSVIAAQAN